jgi:hypothetical protein
MCTRIKIFGEKNKKVWTMLLLYCFPKNFVQTFIFLTIFVQEQERLTIKTITSYLLPLITNSLFFLSNDISTYFPTKIVSNFKNCLSPGSSIGSFQFSFLFISFFRMIDIIKINTGRNKPNVESKGNEYLLRNV